MGTKPVYVVLARALAAMQNCEKTGNDEWFDRWETRILDVTRNWLPHGSGIDQGTRFLFKESTPDKLVFQADFHHMDENGYYAGWSEHKVVVTASLQFGFDIKVTGRNRNMIKEYLGDTYHYALGCEIEEY